MFDDKIKSDDLKFEIRRFSIHQLISKIRKESRKGYFRK